VDTASVGGPGLLPVSLLAAQAGKDMYAEKPLGLSIDQDLKSRAIVDTHLSEIAVRTGKIIE